MTTKLIITNESSLSDSEALILVSKVVAEGRVSNDGKDYCFATVFTNNVAVYSLRNKKSDRFIVRDYKT